MIGTVRIPPKIYEAMRQATVYDLQISLERRIAHIVKEYGSFDKQLLAGSTKKLEKKMGNLRMQQALDFLYNNELNAWVFMLLRNITIKPICTARNKEILKVLSMCKQQPIAFKKSQK